MGEQEKSGAAQTVPQQKERQQINQEIQQVATHQQDQNGVVPMEVDMAAQQPIKEAPQKLQHNESLDDEEDFSCPPALETIEVQQQQEREQAIIQQEEQANVLNNFV